jgi:hypothetical protein
VGGRPNRARRQRPGRVARAAPRLARAPLTMVFAFRLNQAIMLALARQNLAAVANRSV